ncbi:MAG: patatin-like phospholipase family protein [Bacteroidales bacterium]|nr:patatin-like phospholipase family protein [Bacteroidales bacterium]MBN2762567.1 patatin-like phospholipase family protein [Bacteroidales bacterium]
MKKNVALVLSSGGARGFAHIGVINALEKKGFKITSVAGASMGALVGGIYATGQLKQFEEWVTTLDIMEVLKLTDLTISSKGFVKGKKIIQKMKEMIPDKNIEDLKIPYSAVATNIIDGEESVFSQGSLYDAIRASISIPTVFQPHKSGEHYYIDGGVLNPVPINRVKRKKNDLLVVVNVNARIPYKKKKSKEEKHHDNALIKQLKLLQKKINAVIPENKTDDIGFFNLTNKSISLMLYKISALSMEKHNIDLLINVSRDSFGTYDFYKAKDIIKEGEKAAQKTLKEYLKNG